MINDGGKDWRRGIGYKVIWKNTAKRVKAYLTIQAGKETAGTKYKSPYSKVHIEQIEKASP